MFPFANFFQQINAVDVSVKNTYTELIINDVYDEPFLDNQKCQNILRISCESFSFFPV